MDFDFAAIVDTYHAELKALFQSKEVKAKRDRPDSDGPNSKSTVRASSAHGNGESQHDQLEDQYTAEGVACIPWSWVAERLARLFKEYSTGLTHAITLGELELQWEDEFRKQIKGFDNSSGGINAVYECKAKTVALEAMIKDYKLIPDSDIWMINLVDDRSLRSLDMYVHPKFYPWITASRESLSATSQQEFLKERTIRVLCPPIINTPVLSQFNNEDLPRDIRIALAPPTPLLVFVLRPSDAAFIKQEFTDTLQNVIPPGFMGLAHTKQHKLWLKIIHVEKSSHVANHQDINTGFAIATRHRTKQLRVDIFLVDMSGDSDPAVLSLYDEETKLAPMMRRGDYVGLFNPGFPEGATTESQDSHSDIVFEYNDDTVLFLMSEKDARQAGVVKLDRESSNQPSEVRNSFTSVTSSNATQKKEIMERDEEGFMDCSMYEHRIRIKDLSSMMLNVTILGQVTAMANNSPYTKPDGKTKMDRYAMRVDDDTGQMDVTLWDEVGRSARRLQPGDIVLMVNLATSSLHKTARGMMWYVNGSLMCGTEILNVSRLKTLLVSTPFRRKTRIADIKGEGQWQVEAMIVGWEMHVPGQEASPLLCDSYSQRSQSTNSSPDAKKSQRISQDFEQWGRKLGDYITVDAHSECLRPIREGKLGQGMSQDGQEAAPEEDEFGTQTCAFCQKRVPATQVVQVFRDRASSCCDRKSGSQDIQEGWIAWRLDDGSGGTLLAYSGEETLLNISAQQFRLMSHEAQVGYLDSVIGKQVLCALSSWSDAGFRIDQVAPFTPRLSDCALLMAARQS